MGIEVFDNRTGDTSDFGNILDIDDSLAGTTVIIETSNGYRIVVGWEDLEKIEKFLKNYKEK